MSTSLVRAEKISKEKKTTHDDASLIPCPQQLKSSCVTLRFPIDVDLNEKLSAHAAQQQFERCCCVA